jgi:AhpC/TSA antioxidant enzyme
VQWSRRLPELASNNIKLVMVSVGKPHIGKELIQHLGFQGGENHLFVDPDNELYDSLNLNRGVQRTFFNANTAFAFLDRFTRKDGTKDLGEVLSKWSQGALLRLAKRRFTVIFKASLSNHHFFKIRLDFGAAVYVPPKPDQAFLQGGTFVFRGTQTLFAHYDPSTAAHASIDEVMDVAKVAASASATTPV